jgi:uncharacterized protein YdhG (YjbR/CyaY superfamily)
MPKTGFKSLDDYFTSQPNPVRQILERVRRAIRKTVPGVEEIVSYKMPTFQLNEGVMLYLAAWKKHYSLYPATGRLLAAFKNDLAPYEVNKSTIRFPLSEPVPVELIERIAKFRATAVAERGKVELSKAKPEKRKRR